MLAEDLMPATAQHIDAVAEGLSFKERLFVLGMTDMLFHDSLFNTHGFPLLQTIGFQDRVHLGPESNKLSDRPPSALVLHFPSTFLFAVLNSGCSLG